MALSTGIDIYVKDGTREIKATINAGKWICSDPDFKIALSWVHLLPGHHADRDLELAKLAVKYFKGQIDDHRPEPALAKLPK